MDTNTVILAILTSTTLAAAFQAWRLGNEKRGVALFGAISGFGGVGTAVATIL